MNKTIQYRLWGAQDCNYRPDGWRVSFHQIDGHIVVQSPVKFASKGDAREFAEQLADRHPEHDYVEVDTF